MSDIGILSDPISQIKSRCCWDPPGLLLGTIAGALLWKRHRFAPCSAPPLALSFELTGWLTVNDFI